MSTNTPFHQDNTNPPQPPYPPVKPAKERTSIPVWAWALGALLVVLIVAGSIVLGNKNSDDPAPAPAVTVTETAEPKAEPTPSEKKKTETPKAAPAPTSAPSEELTEQDRRPVAMSEADFLAFLREEYPILNTVSDEEILAYSDRTCDALDNGVTPEEIMIDAIVSSESEEQAGALGAIAGGSVSNYCPEHYGDFVKFLEEQGAATIES